MSFGFGVGDFLAVIQLANKIRKRFSDAPAKLQAISNEVKCVSVLLSDVEVYADTVVERLGPGKAKELETVVNSSRHVLQDIDDLLSKYEDVSPTPPAKKGHRIRWVWERLMFEPGDISDLRARLTSNITVLEAFVVNITQRRTQASLERLEKHVDGQEQQRILDWVSADCQRHIDRLNGLVHCLERGTRRWLFESPEWQAWTGDQGRGTTLFCPGIPGAGKTHTSAMVIERLYTLFPSAVVGIAFAFCDYQRSDEREHLYLARNLLRMILEQPQVWPDALRQAYESARRSRSEITLDEVFDILRASMRPRARNFVVIDALDELDRACREALMPRLFELQRCTGLNMLVTSRDITQVGDLFRGTPRLRIKATGEDIEQYISTRMPTLPSFVTANPGLQDQIKESVVQAAGEMFLLADLHIRSLRTKRSPKALRKALQNLLSGPDSTREALDAAMRRVSSQPEETASTALNTLMILTTARRPLTVDELCHALAVDLDDFEDGFDEDNVPLIDYTLSSCAGLVIVEAQARRPVLRSGAEDPSCATAEGPERPSGDRIVQVAHKSIRDYLSSPQSGWFPHAEESMAAICRIYKEAYDRSDTKRGFHFLSYVRNHWGYHLSKSDREVSEAPMGQDMEAQIVRQASFPLALRQASHQFGLRQLALELEGTRENLLMWACQNDRMNIVEILLANDLDSYLKPFARLYPSAGAYGGCGYDWCSVHGGGQDIYPGCARPPPPGHGGFAEDLCDAKTSDTRIISGAVVAAAGAGSISIAETLLQHGASVAGRGQSGFTALGMAALNGHSDMLRWLLDQEGMDAKLFFDIQPRLVFEASWAGKKWRLGPHLRNAPPRPQGTAAAGRKVPGERCDGRVAATALAAASFSGHETCVGMLLEWMQKHRSEAPAAAWESSCMSAVLCALHKGHMAVLRALLPFIDINSPAPGFNGYTILHFAVLLLNREAISLILADKAVDTNLGDKNGRTVLALAARLGADDLIEELWARGPGRLDPLAAAEALIGDHETAFNLLCRLFLGRSPGGLLAADSTGYSCLDRIIYLCTREMALANPDIASEDALRAEFEDLDAFDWTPIPWRKPRTAVPFYAGVFGRLSTRLLDRTNSAVFCEASDGEAEFRFGVNTLYLALASCSDELLRALLQLCPAAVCDIDSRGGTILMAAFVKGSPRSIDIVLKALEKQKNATVVNSLSGARHSALTAALWIGRLDHQRQFHSLLMFPGFDLRLAFHRDEKGNCPLLSLVMLTAEHTTLPLSRMKSDQQLGISTTCDSLYRTCWFLFKALSDSVDPWELSALYHQLSEDLSRRAGCRFVDVLCSLPKPGCLELFLGCCVELRAQLHTTGASGMTTLMQASRAWRHHETLMSLLGTWAVDPFQRDREGRTALSHVAENLGQFSDGGAASTLIRQHGQDPLAVDKKGWPPLAYAVANGNVWEGSPYADLLIDPNTLVDWTDESGSTPLHLAIRGGSPLAVQLLLQHPSSPGWLNAADAEGLVPLAHFFLSPRDSKHMCYYRLRYPHSGVKRRVLSMEDSLHYHRQAQEAVQGTLHRADILPDAPDKEGKTPLWHALEAIRAEYGGSFGAEYRDGGHFHGFLRSSVEALCARDDVDPLRLTHTGSSPFELAAELVQIRSRVKAGASGVAGISPPGGGDAKAEMRAMVKALRPMVSAHRASPSRRGPLIKRYRGPRGLCDAKA